MNSVSKKCSKCNEVRPIEDFYWKRKDKGRRFSWCKSCHKLMIDSARAKDPKKHIARCIAWQKANPDKVIEIRRRTVEKHRAKLNSKARDYQSTPAAKEKRKRWKLANKEREDANRVAYRESNRAELTEKSKAYYRNNKESCAASAKRCREAKWDQYKQIRKAIKERRRVRIASNAPVEKFTHLEIFDRDNWTCHLCGEMVDKELSYPDPLSASLDHVKPVTKGGGHTRDNVACSHLRCNLKKRNLFERRRVA